MFSLQQLVRAERPDFNAPFGGACIALTPAAEQAALADWFRRFTPVAEGYGIQLPAEAPGSLGEAFDLQQQVNEAEDMVMASRDSLARNWLAADMAAEAAGF